LSSKLILNPEHNTGYKWFGTAEVIEKYGAEEESSFKIGHKELILIWLMHHIKEKKVKM
jgi:hypothetical protein